MDWIVGLDGSNSAQEGLRLNSTGNPRREEPAAERKQINLVRDGRQLERLANWLSHKGVSGEEALGGETWLWTLDQGNF